MRIRLTITAKSDADPSCLLYTVTESFYYGIADPPEAHEIKRRAEETKQKLQESWPHPGITWPTLIPVEADVRVVNDR